MIEKAKLPDGWIKTKIGEILTRVKKPVKVDAKQLYKEIGIRSHGKGIFYKEPKTGHELGNKSVFWIEPECLVLNIVFAWEQAVTKTSESELGFIASHRFPMYKPLSNKTDIDFLLYLFKTKRGKFLLELASPGGAGRNKTLGQKEFAELTVILPPVSEQHHIANILSTWDKAIKQLDNLIEAKRQRKKALMQRLLTGKLRLPEFEGQKWEASPLSEIAIVIMGTSPKSSAYNNLGRGLPLLQGNADIKKRLSAPRVYTSEITKECKIKDILLSVRAPVGKVSRSIHHACIGRGISTIRAKKGVSQNYLYQWMLYYEPRWTSLSQGSTFESVNGSDIRALRISIPKSIQEQTRIATILSAADAEITQLEEKLSNYKEQKKGLMQQLLTGKKRVTIKNKEAA